MLKRTGPTGNDVFISRNDVVVVQSNGHGKWIVTWLSPNADKRHHRCFQQLFDDLDSATMAAHNCMPV